jgi:hypothetical protein
MRLPLALAAAAAAVLLPAVPAADGAFRGRLEVRHSDDFAHGRTHTGYRLVQGGRHIPLMLTRAPRTPSGTKVVVRGRRVGSRIVAKSVRSRGTARAAGVTAGARKTAVILINFVSDTRTPWTPDFVRQRVFTDTDSVSAFYSEESYGDVSLTGKLRSDGDVFGWYTIDAATAGCHVGGWADKAEQAAATDGFVSSDYDHVIYVFPNQSSCGGWAGLGELPGSHAWINGTTSVRVIAHELGHNMGLHHASSLVCSDAGTPVSYASSGCTPDEYGDPFDVMGSSLRHNNAWHLRQIGFMQSGNVQTVSTSGTYTVGSALTSGTGTQLLRVPVAGTSPQRYYDLEQRASGGVFDNFVSTSPAVQGVTIHIDPTTAILTQSLLIDATPGSGAGFADAPLAPGESFTDGSVTISVSSVSGGVATVDVLTSAPPEDTTPPSAPALAATPAADSVTLSWPASTDDVGVAGYRVYRDGQLKATVSVPGWADHLVSSGATYNYVVTAFDVAGNAAPSAEVSATVPQPPPPDPPASTTSTTPPPADPPAGIVDPPLPPPVDARWPTVRIKSPGPSARLRRRATIRWRAADDIAVVRTEIWIDGTLRRITGGRGTAWRWSVRSERRGVHLIVVRAFDAAGHAGRAVRHVRVVR